jgi:hypothetical protein
MDSSANVDPPHELLYYPSNTLHCSARLTLLCCSAFIWFKNGLPNVLTYLRKFYMTTRYQLLWLNSVEWQGDMNEDVVAQADHTLTHSMERSPSEPNRFSASQKIPCILCNPKVHYRVDKCPPPVSILGQINPVHAPLTHLLKIHFNTIFPFKPGSSKWSLSIRFPHQNPACTSPPCVLPAPHI